MAHLTAHGLLELVLDEGSFESWDSPVDHTGLDPQYRQELVAAAERAGTDESVLTGRGLMRGRPVAVLVNEFRFLAGSIGREAAQRIVSAVRRATAEGIPVLATTASGGTRMQEGTPAFVHMIDISRAIMDHRAAGLPYLIYLRHPTTGGVFASWGSLAHITIAEPGALIGFLGPKVYELLEGKPFPPNIQTAENLADRGIIDAVVLPDELPLLIDRTLGLLVDAPTEQTRERRTGEVHRVRSAWDVDPDHPSSRTRRRTRGAALRQRRDRAPAGHREGRARQRHDRRLRATRRSALRRHRPGPHDAVALQADGTGRAARGASRDAAGQ